MKSFSFRTLLILSLATPAFASEPNQEEGVQAQVQSVIETAPCHDKQKGTIEDLAARLQALTEPMEQKVDDCDGEVAKAKEILASLEKSLTKETLAIRKTNSEILLLKEALGNRGCELTIGGCKFRREVLAEGLEKRLQQYEQIAVLVKELRTSVVAQKGAVQAAIAKLERWQTKEKELLQSVELLQKSHEELFGAEAPAQNGDAIKQAARVEAEVESMLGLKAASPEPNVAERSESPKAPEAEPAKQDITVKTVSSATVIDVEADAEIEVDIEVETEVEVDAEFDIEVLDEIFEKS
jgi:hypothetical protein